MHVERAELKYTVVAIAGTFRRNRSRFVVGDCLENRGQYECELCKHDILKPYNEELQKLHSAPNIIRMLTSRSIHRRKK
jgi:hypothetical protein